MLVPWTRTPRWNLFSMLRPRSMPLLTTQFTHIDLFLPHIQLCELHIRYWGRLSSFASFKELNARGNWSKWLQRLSTQGNNFRSTEFNIAIAGAIYGLFNLLLVSSYTIYSTIKIASFFNFKFNNKSLDEVWLHKLNLIRHDTLVTSLLSVQSRTVKFR